MGYTLYMNSEEGPDLRKRGQYGSRFDVARNVPIKLGDKEFFHPEHAAEASYCIGTLLAPIMPVAPVTWVSDIESRQTAHLSEKFEGFETTRQTLAASFVILKYVFSDSDHSLVDKHNVVWDETTNRGYIYDLEETIHFFFPADGYPIPAHAIASEEIAFAIQKQLLKLLELYGGPDGLKRIQEVMGGHEVRKVFYFSNHYLGEVGQGMSNRELVKLFQSTLIERVNGSLEVVEKELVEYAENAKR